jgi:uncharacterized protein YaaN involved in tellurite resistance
MAEKEHKQNEEEKVTEKEQKELLQEVEEEQKQLSETEEDQSQLPEVVEETSAGTALKEEIIKDGILRYEDADEVTQTKMDVIASEIDIKNPHTVIFYGAKAQENINRVSESMLEGVKNKDLGHAADSLNNLVAEIQGFDVDALNPNQTQGFFSKLFGMASPVVKFIGKYEEVRKQIDAITDNLEQQKTQLLTDITSLERLYKVNFEFFKELELYIAAGVHKLEQLDNEIIPKLEAEAAGNKKMQKALKLQDIINTRNDLERRIHDLRLTRQVAMQALPTIRMVQDNDKSLVSKISSVLVNTVPLWKNQLAQAITIYRSAEAAKAVKGATDMTNELLEENAKALKEANRETREQIERGVYDIESIKKANQTLIDTIQESLEIAVKGKETRRAAEEELVKIENQLHDALLAAGKIRH